MDGKEVNLDIIVPDLSSSMPLPFAESGVQAGFPSPASDYLPESFDLNREIVRHPAATFYARVHGESMIGEGISDGDLIVVDRSLEPKDGDLVVCAVDGEFTLKRITFRPGAVWLIPSNEQFDPILVTPDKQFEVWGVVTHTIRRTDHR
ncbi:MAG: translesion error-prone DNA polymerase V autoproteolytic subunit [Muribaculaceae bacterium]|nr:translesion error-prone DNA polymerase V autoproteolytic subunit [Muribaculaceae bacterium]